MDARTLRTAEVISSERVRGGVVIEFSTGEAALYPGELLLRMLSEAEGLPGVEPLDETVPTEGGAS